MDFEDFGEGEGENNQHVQVEQNRCCSKVIRFTKKSYSNGTKIVQL